MIDNKFTELQNLRIGANGEAPSYSELGHATAHAPDIDGKPAKALMAVNYAVIPVRPAGGGWSSVRETAKYVSMELAEGKLPDGKTYISKGPLLERREPQVWIGKDVSTAWGLLLTPCMEWRSFITGAT